LTNAFWQAAYGPKGKDLKVILFSLTAHILKLSYTTSDGKVDTIERKVISIDGEKYGIDVKSGHIF
jgi:hypothetical protein